MKEDFKLDHTSKKMPYQVPAGFFENITQATLQEAKRREAAAVKPRSILGWQVWSVAASLALLIVAGYFLLRGPQQPQPEMAQTTSAPAPVEGPAPVPAQIISPSKETEKQAAVVSPKARQVREEKKEKTQPVPSTKPQNPESFDNLLASLTDEDLAELAALASAEAYVYEETLQ